MRYGATAFWLTALLCLRCASSAPRRSQAAPALVSPVLAWGTKPLFALSGTSQVSYETLPLSQAWSGLLKDVLVKDPSLGLAVIFVSHQVETWELGQLGSSPLLEPLRSAMQNAPSSVAYVNLLNEGQSAAGLTASVYDTAAQIGADVQVLGPCSSGEHAEDVGVGFERIIGKTLSDKPCVVLVCGSGDSAEEMAQLRSVLTALQSRRGDHACLFVSDIPEDELVLASRRRSLLQQNVSSLGADVCDELCQTQVKFVEGAILLLLMAFAAVVGLCCLSIMDTPSAFEKKRDAE
ncbi:unnamed protein product [Ostreobium quekettii]|uniref:Uncharacterized protein n=1 Tax=Ostreobium quekettii TaxID=121088 RepID=A0A8S1J9C6_9CHLO|nr:unnamed protein product [Ostreobium quekettii]|eukprot:evm.model.scf_2266.1 EVM.evm.TU.scf_2266.1   scf_2266:15235-19918(+)